MRKNKNNFNFFEKTWFSLVSGTVINIGVYIIFKPISPWIIVLIYFIAVIPKAIDANKEIRLAKINAERQVRRDEIHNS